MIQSSNQWIGPVQNRVAWDVNHVRCNCLPRSWIQDLLEPNLPIRCRYPNGPSRWGSGNWSKDRLWARDRATRYVPWRRCGCPRRGLPPSKCHATILVPQEAFDPVVHRWRGRNSDLHRVRYRMRSRIVDHRLLRRWRWSPIPQAFHWHSVQNQWTQLGRMRFLQALRQWWIVLRGWLHLHLDPAWRGSGRHPWFLDPRRWKSSTTRSRWAFGKSTRRHLR